MRKISLLVGLAIAFVIAMLHLSPVASSPNDAAFTVNTQLDGVDDSIGNGVCHTANGTCTLRAAIQEANALFASNPGSFYTVTLPGPQPSLDPYAARVYTLTIGGSGEDFSASGDLDIQANMLIRSSNGRSVVVTAEGLGDRVFHIIQPPSRQINVSFAQVSMVNGSSSNFGGGLYIESAKSVTLSSLAVTTNSVQSQIANGGGIAALGNAALTLNNVTVRGNAVIGGDQGAAVGGGIFATGNVALNGSSVLSNSAASTAPTDTIFAFGGGITVGCCDGSLTLNSSTVSHNQILVGISATAVEGVGIYAIVPVTVVNSTISDNRFSPPGSTTHDTLFEGGGMYVDSSLTMLTSTVTNNQLQTHVSSRALLGGGLLLGGRSLIVARVITGNSLLSQNRPDGQGGGISIGDYALAGDLVLERSVVASNQSESGGGLMVFPTSTLTLRDSAIHTNYAGVGGGGGINNRGMLTVTNSTFEGNASLIDGGAIESNGIATVASATFHGNIADLDDDHFGDGGAISVIGTFYLRHSLFSGNQDLSTSGGMRPDCTGTVISLDYNMMEQSPGSLPGCNLIGANSHNVYGIFPNVLAPLFQNNGGDTPTRALPAGSVAINAGDPTGCKDENGSPLLTDQRGFPRLGACDIGAYEFVLRDFLPAILR